jgi:hypothetical protein
MPDARARLPGSLFSVRTVARLAIAAGTALTMTELLPLCSSRESWIPLLLLPPAAACFAFADALARGKVKVRLFAGTVGAALVVMVGAMIGVSFISLVASIMLAMVAGFAMLFVTAAALSSPVLIAAATLGRCTDLEAGDAMLGWSGAWLVALQVLALFAVGSMHRGAAAASGVAIFGIAAGVVTVGVYAGRAVARRRWCARVIRGELPGWRVREEASRDELSTLPAIFGGASDVSAVVERVEMGGALYRSGLIAYPMAAMRLMP